MIDLKAFLDTFGPDDEVPNDATEIVAWIREAVRLMRIRLDSDGSAVGWDQEVRDHIAKLKTEHLRRF